MTDSPGAIEVATTEDPVVSLPILREELHSFKEAMLTQIKTEIGLTYKDMITNIASLREEMKAKIRAIHDEVAELARLRSAHSEAEAKNTQRWEKSSWWDGAPGL